MLDYVLALGPVEGDLAAQACSVGRGLAEEDLEALDGLVDAPDLAVRPARDAVLAADLFKHRGAYAEGFGDFYDGKVEIPAQDLLGEPFFVGDDHLFFFSFFSLSGFFLYELLLFIYIFNVVCVCL